MTETVDWVAIIIGLFGGLVIFLFGMELMGFAMEPLAEYEPFVEATGSLERILPAVIVGAVFTALVHRKRIPKMAIIGDKKWQKWRTAFIDPYSYSREAQFFTSSEHEAAWEWFQM